ncbi:MAG: hypothetical protein WKG32_08205 [Gemmatimonadaceae bacterium]
MGTQTGALAQRGAATAAGTVPTVPYPILIDDGWTSVAGATTALTLHRALYELEDRLLPVSVARGADMGARSVDFFYRFAKVIFVDNALDAYGATVTHEYVGHGARAREFGFRDVRYRFGAPFPFGGEAYTEYGSPSGWRLLSPTEEALLTVAGIEANNVGGKLNQLRAVRRGSMHYHDALAHLVAYFDGFGYVLGTNPADTSMGHDILAYLGVSAARYGVRGSRSGDVRRLQRQALLSLLNPYHLSALYGVASYVEFGRERVRLPALRLRGGVRYVPWLRTALTPFGTDVVLENAFVRGERLLDLSVRVGDGRYRAAWGLGMLAAGALRTGAASLDVTADAWRQPAITVGGATIRERRGGYGGALSGTVTWELPPVPLVHAPLGVVVQLGYKTPGFLEGERLDRGVIARAGGSVRAP